MTEPSPFRYGPTRGELWFWLCVNLGGLTMMSLAIIYHGFPGGPPMAEVVGLPLAAFGCLGGRSVERLTRRQHP